MFPKFSQYFLCTKSWFEFEYSLKFKGEGWYKNEMKTLLVLQNELDSRLFDLYVWYRPNVKDRLEKIVELPVN